MGRYLLGLTLVVCACKASIGDGPSDDAGLVDAIAATTDAPPDAFVLGAWGPPALVPGASSTAIEDDASLSSTTLEMVFAIVNTADANRKDLYYQSRPSPTGTWTAPQKLPFSLTGSSEETPRFSGDDLHALLRVGSHRHARRPRRLQGHAAHGRWHVGHGHARHRGQLDGRRQVVRAVWRLALPGGRRR